MKKLIIICIFSLMFLVSCGEDWKKTWQNINTQDNQEYIWDEEWYINPYDEGSFVWETNETLTWSSTDEIDSSKVGSENPLNL